MLNFHEKISRKYFLIELLFLLSVCFFIPVISDLEYSYYEQNDIGKFVTSLEYRLVYGLFSFILYSVYYWLFLKPSLFKKKTLYVVLSVLAFIFISHLYNKYQNWAVARMFFISQELRVRAMHDFRTTRLYFIVSYILSRIVFTFVGFAYLIKSLQQEEEVKELKEQHLVTELNYLKAQLQPHFFFNTLNNIYSLAIKRSEHTAALVARLSEMMRYIIYDAAQVKVPLSQEIAFLTNYTEIEKIRYPATADIRFEVQGNTLEWDIEPLLFLPLIENAFKHGLRNELNAGFIHIIMCLTEKELILQVTNSKPAEITGIISGGLGLVNTTRRLALGYRNRHDLHTEETLEFYQVVLSLQK